MGKTSIVVAAILGGSLARAQTVPLAPLAGPEAAPLAVPDAGLLLPSSELAAPLAVPVESLSAAERASAGAEAPLRAPERPRSQALPRAIRAVRSAALASMVAGAAALGLPACTGDAPVVDAGVDAGYQYPPGYINYPNGHPIAALATESQQTSLEDQMYNAVNAYRAQNGLGPLIPSGVIGDMSRANSIHMPEHDYFSTENPEGDGPEQRAQKVQAPHTDIAEAIVQGAETTDPNAALKQMLNNYPQALNLPDGNRMGAGFFNDPTQGPFWTVDVVHDPTLTSDAGYTYNPYNDAGVQMAPDSGPIPSLDGGLPDATLDGGDDDGGE